MAAAKDALAAADNQWAAQLADYLLAINKDEYDAKRIKADALTKLARNSINATARNYYLTVAREQLPELKVRVVNVVDLMKLQPASEHPHGCRVCAKHSMQGLDGTGCNLPVLIKPHLID